jgi:hypothetical protein
MGAFALGCEEVAWEVLQGFRKIPRRTALCVFGLFCSVFQDETEQLRAGD